MIMSLSAPSTWGRGATKPSVTPTPVPAPTDEGCTDEDDPADCTALIEAADKAIAAQKKEVETCKLGVKLLDDENVKLTTDVLDKERQLSAWYRNPFYILGLGLVGGLVTGAILTK